MTAVNIRASEPDVLVVMIGTDRASRVFPRQRDVDLTGLLQRVNVRATRHHLDAGVWVLATCDVPLLRARCVELGVSVVVIDRGSRSRLSARPRPHGGSR